MGRQKSVKERTDADDIRRALFTSPGPHPSGQLRTPAGPSMHSSDNQVTPSGAAPPLSGSVHSVSRVSAAIANLQPLQVYLRIKPLDRGSAGQHGDESDGRVTDDPSEDDQHKKSSSNDTLMTIRTLDSQTVQTEAPAQSYAFKRGEAQALYRFTNVFDQSSSQNEVYEGAAFPLLSSCLQDNSHALLFAYGCTNAGKTYTILGPDGNGQSGQSDKTGVVPRLFSSLFRSIDAVSKPAKGKNQPDVSGTGDDSGVANLVVPLNPDKRYAVWISFLEIYNENIYDLLKGANEPADRTAAPYTKTPGGSDRAALKLKEDKTGRVFVKGLKEVLVKTASEASAVLADGIRQRSVGQTALNRDSSRSHSVLTIKVVAVPSSATRAALKSNGAQLIQYSKLAIVDLAGSERSRRTQATGGQLRESANINKSLSTFHRCLESLQWNVAHKNARQPRIPPFRDSQLTRLLQDYFLSGGAASMIVNVNPSPTEFDETSNVLKISALAQEVKIGARTDCGRGSLWTPSGGAGPSRIAKEETDLWEMTVSADQMDDGPMGTFDPETEVALPIEDLDALVDEVEAARASLDEVEEIVARVEADVREEVSEEMAERLETLEMLYKTRLHEEIVAIEEKFERKLAIVERVSRALVECADDDGNGSESLEDRDKPLDDTPSAGGRTRGRRRKGANRDAHSTEECDTPPSVKARVSDQSKALAFLQTENEALEDKLEKLSSELAETRTAAARKQQHLEMRMKSAEADRAHLLTKLSLADERAAAQEEKHAAALADARMVIDHHSANADRARARIHELEMQLNELHNRAAASSVAESAATGSADSTMAAAPGTASGTPSRKTSRRRLLRSGRSKNKMDAAAAADEAVAAAAAAASAAAAVTATAAATDGAPLDGKSAKSHQDEKQQTKKYAQITAGRDGNSKVITGDVHQSVTGSGVSVTFDEDELNAAVASMDLDDFGGFSGGHDESPADTEASQRSPNTTDTTANVEDVVKRPSTRGSRATKTGAAAASAGGKPATRGSRRRKNSGSGTESMAQSQFHDEKQASDADEKRESPSAQQKKGTSKSVGSRVAKAESAADTDSSATPSKLPETTDSRRDINAIMAKYTGRRAAAVAGVEKIRAVLSDDTSNAAAADSSPEPSHANSHHELPMRSPIAPLKPAPTTKAGANASKRVNAVKQRRFGVFAQTYSRKRSKQALVRPESVAVFDFPGNGNNSNNSNSTNNSSGVNNQNKSNESKMGSKKAGSDRKLGRGPSQQKHVKSVKQVFAEENSSSNKHMPRKQSKRAMMATTNAIYDRVPSQSSF